MVSSIFNKKQPLSATFNFIKKEWGCLLILLTFLGFVSKSLFSYPLGVMAILGLYKIISAPEMIKQDPILNAFTLVFMCLWLPLLISYPDAVNQSHAAQTVFPYLRFFFAGIFIIETLSKNHERLDFIIFGLFCLVFFWCIDASIQFAFGHNLLGFSQPTFMWESEATGWKGMATGMFYQRNTIGHICAALATFYFLYIYLNLNRKKWLLLSLLPLFFIVLLSGRRAAWIMLGVTSFGFLFYWYLYAINRKAFIKLVGSITILITVILTTTISFHDVTNSRFKTALGLFSNNFHSINSATNGRVLIWGTAYRVFKSNPINGIGPRGFRYIYNDYAKPGDWRISENEPATHPHIIILEILAETGLIGVAGYLFAFFILFKIIKKSGDRRGLFPFLLAVIVALLPFNAHMAFYGSVWASTSWLLIALYFAKAKTSSSLLKNENP